MKKLTCLTYSKKKADFDKYWKSIKNTDINGLLDFRFIDNHQNNLLFDPPGIGTTHLSIDEIGYTPIDKDEADYFFNIISKLYERNSIIITSNRAFESWAEVLGDEIMTTALLDRILHQAHIFASSGEAYKIKKTNKEE